MCDVDMYSSRARASDSVMMSCVSCYSSYCTFRLFCGVPSVTEVLKASFPSSSIDIVQRQRLPHAARKILA